MPRGNNSALPSPWAGFLHELDALLPEQVEVHCIGGFVVSLYYGLPRPTADIDYCSVLPAHCAQDLQTMGGQGSVLDKRYKVHLQFVAVNTLPEDYEARLAEMFPGQFRKLRLYAADPYDLILSKLERNSQKDRDDVAFLARSLHLGPQVLRERYEKEWRPYVTNEARHDLTLNLWLDTCFEGHASP